ncbi:MAG: ABC transporter substrate-binding protein [Deltaproteobacteria bacterium]|nr:ABC transporter substrate-binding protein [Deltaproteobacteria bacterium]
MKNLLLNRLFLRCTSEWLAFGCALFPQCILKTAFLAIVFLLISQNTDASAGLRIISLAPDLTEIVYALGLEEHLVGVSDYSDFPADAQTKPSVGSFIAPNLEKILLLNPSVVLTELNATPSQITQALQTRKISVLSFQARTESDIYETLRTLGQKFNKEKKASQLISSMQKSFKEAFLKTQKQSSQKPSVLVQIEEIPLMVAGKNTLIDRAIVLAGGENAARKYTGYPKLQREVLLKLKPDIVILPETKGQEQKLKRMSEAWEKNKTPVVILSGDLLTRATPRFCEGVQILVGLLAHSKTP